MWAAARLAVAIAAGLVLADASVVVLALPPILLELDASVEGAAAVIAAYTLALALALPVALAVRRAAPRRVVTGAALMAFGAASAGCGLVDSLTPLVLLRAVQGATGAGVLIGAFELLRAGEPETAGRRTWVVIGVVGAAVGPALGGALTQAFDWRAIFLVQAPIAVTGGLVVLLARLPPVPPPALAGPPPGTAWRGLVALGLVSAALTGVLFLLVLLLVTGWALSPLAAAAVASVLPVAAVLGMRAPGNAAERALAGAVLVAAGVGALAFLPGDAVWLTIVPQLVAGLGMGLALPALAGGLMPERTPADAARGLAARHVGVTLALALLAPIAAAQLEGAERDVRLRGTAIILDARLPPLDKLDLAETATAPLDTIAPRTALRRSLDRAVRDGPDDQRAELRRVRERADEALVAAIDRAFRPAFLVSGGLALLAALLLAPNVLRRAPVGRTLALAGVALVLVPAQAAVAAAVAPPAVAIADPCEDRDLPSTGGIAGFLQDRALELLAAGACEAGSSREELALALLDEDRAREFETEYGVNPRSVSGVLGALLD